MSAAIGQDNGACWMMICESRDRWAAAVRAELSTRQKISEASRVVSVETTERLAGLTSASPPVLLGLEVHQDTLQQQLADITRWRSESSICVIGLTAETITATDARSSLATLLYAAGAVHVLASPLRIGQLLDVADRHAEEVWRRLRGRLPAEELLWRRLPWQPPPWAIG